LRRDPVSRGWVIISPEHGLQPSDFGSVAMSRTSRSCSFGEGREGETGAEILAIRRPDTRVDGPGWQVRVIPTEPAVLAERERVVTANERFIAIAPYASRCTFEVWSLPREENPHYLQVRDRDLLDLAAILQKVLRGIKNALEDPPYNFVLHTAPLPAEGEETPSYHWHIEVIPRLTRLAGFEWGTGFYVNPTPPEEAARLLREVLALRGTLA